MANFNEQKIYSELSKLSTNELYIVFGKIKEWVSKKLISEQEKLDEQSSELASKIQKL